jgi:hypothetical protein
MTTYKEWNDALVGEFYRYRISSLWTYLTGHGNLLTRLISNWTRTGVVIVKYDGDRGFCDASLSLLIYKFLKVSNADLSIFAL